MIEKGGKSMTKDLTKGNPTKLILLFTLPLLLGNLFQQFYSMADTVIVGRTIGVNALAAVGATGSIMFLILGFAQGLTSGFSIVTAQRFGAEDYEGVRRSVTTSVMLSAVITVILTALSMSLAMSVLKIMNTPSEIIEDSYRYIIVIYGGIGACVLFNLLSNIIRALGDSKTPLVFLIIACILNIALDFIFILSFSMGVAGAAWATIIAQLLSGILCILYMIKKLPILRFHKNDWKPDCHWIVRHLKVGLPMAFQMSIIAIGTMILQTALNALGATAVAAFTAAQKIDTVATQPLMSFGVTMSTYAAQNYGAGNISRIRQGVRQCSILSVVVSLLSGAGIILASTTFVKLFVGGDQPEVIRLAKIYLIFNCSMYFMLSLLFIYRYTLQGLGKSLIPTVAGIMELIMRTIAAVFLAQSIGFAGVSMASPIAWIGALIPLAFAYFYTIKKLEKSSLRHI